MTLPDLCPILLAWAVQLSGLPAPAGGACPALVPVPHAWLEAQACGGRPCRVLGWYPGAGEAVYLDAALDLSDDGGPVAASIAVHELVHWLQGRAGALAPGSCAQHVAAERQAYAVQAAYLTAQGVYYPVGRVLPHLACED